MNNEFESDVRRAMNSAMAEVHKKWSATVPAEELRLQVCRILSERAYEAAILAARKSTMSTRKVDALITLLRNGRTPAQAAELVAETVANSAGD